MNNKLAINQEEFISKFFSKEESNYHILIAPVGTGKTTVLLKILEKTLQKSNIYPILFFGVHSALITLFFEQIRMHTDNVTILQKKSFLEMDDTSNNNVPFWKNGWVYISTVALLKDERFIKRIKSQKWELLVFDEANIKDVQNIDKINIESKNVLFTLDTSGKLDIELINKYTITEWNVSSYITEKHSLNKVKTYIIKFLRTREEIEYLEIISKFLKETLFTSTGKIIEFKSPSSWYSIEQLLLRIRNIIAHGSESILLWEGEEYLINSSPDKILIIENYLNLISNIELDTKVASLKNLISNLQFEYSSKILIFVNSTASINYLNSLLNKKGYSSKYLHRSLNNNTIMEELDRFYDSGGIMLVSDFILKGLQLSADALIHYDLPSNENLLFLRYTRIHNTKNMINNYFIVEENNEDDFTKLKKLGVIQ